MQMRRRSSGVGTNLLSLREANQRTNSAANAGQTNGGGGAMNKINETVGGDGGNEPHDERLLSDDVDAARFGSDDRSDDDAAYGRHITSVAPRLSASAEAFNPNASGDVAQRTNFGGYLIAVHRQLQRQDTYFLSYHKTRPTLFGVPLLIPCYEGGTNKDLYLAVWMQVERLLSPLPSTPPDQSNHATDW